MSTYWVAFDLDQTLGCFESIHPYLIVFFPDLLHEVYRAPYYQGSPVAKLNVTFSDKQRLANAFTDFVKGMAVSEGKNKLLRPGILNVISMLLAAKKQGLVGGIMIYSNNSNVYMLRFAHELIKTLLGVEEPIFCPLVHWWHPLRNNEVRGSAPMPLSHGPKNVDTIISAFSAGYCRKYYVTIGLANVIFFDDLIHNNIKNIIPAQNYFHVQPYHRAGDFATIHNCFLNALMVNDIDHNLGLIDEFKKTGLMIGPSEAEKASFKAQMPSGYNTDVVDGDVILKRLAKLLHMDVPKAVVPAKIMLRLATGEQKPPTHSGGKQTRRSKRRL
jgi:hypothetical protein